MRGTSCDSKDGMFMPTPSIIARPEKTPIKDQKATRTLPTGFSGPAARWPKKWAIAGGNCGHGGAGTNGLT